ncbi:MAG: hypothetical protein HC773_12190, partial [Scytonema sp. CRU_2_7]|nr:hypothetical protein [Scytonema sp. CRU_2_7]
MTKTLEFISVPPKTGQPPKGLIVTLHGWGANAEDVAYLLPFFNLPDYQFCSECTFPYPQSSIVGHGMTKMKYV